MRMEDGILLSLIDPSDQTADLCYEGDIRKRRGQVELLQYSPKSKITILSISSRVGVSSFTTSSDPHFRKSNIWLGAEGPGLIYQVGRNRDYEKTQLFRLTAGETILFFDAYQEVTAISANTSGEAPLCIRATNVQIAEHILSIAEGRRGNESALKWCFHALEELNCQAQINEFIKRFPRS